MAASRPKPGNSDRGWNDPPMFSFNPSLQQGSPRRLLNKRVAYPAAGLPTPGHAVLAPSTGPPLGAGSGQESSSGIPIPKVIQAPQVGNSALPPALQVVTTAVANQDEPLSPVLLPPSADTSMPVTVPLLVPTIVKPVHPQPEQSQNPAIEEERLTDLLSRLQLQDDGQLINHVMEKFNTLIERHSKMLTEKACEDIRRKLEMFEDKWKKGSLSEPVKTKVTQLVTALVNEEIEKANHLHLALMVDHIAEVNQWMMGVKRLLQQQQLSIREKELLTQNSQITEEQKSTEDSSDNFDNPNTTNSKLSDGASEKLDIGLSAPDIYNSDTTSSKLNDVDESASKNPEAGLMAPDVDNSDTMSRKLNDNDESASKNIDAGLIAPDVDNDFDTMSSKLIDSDGDSAKSEMASNIADAAVNNSSIDTLNNLDKSGVGVSELKTDLEKIDNDNTEEIDSNIASDKISANKDVTDDLEDNSDHQNDETK